MSTSSDDPSPAISVAERVELWDAVLASCRETLRGDGLREVVTPAVVLAPAPEPHIEPQRGGGGFLSTSPELAMKRMLCAGSGSIFQIAPAFRTDEVGPKHRPEFRLLEWYRVGATLDAIQRDVEALVAAAFRAAGRDAPSWTRVDLLAKMRSDLGRPLSGSETAVELEPLLARLRSQLGLSSGSGPPAREDAGTVAAWTELYSLWSTHHLDPWLLAEGPNGVHVSGFPPPLAALARVERGVALRSESFVRGVELANGYDELGDPTELRRRFAAVNRMRESEGRVALPFDHGFFNDLEQRGLPPCAGAALGVERLVMLASGHADLGDIVLSETTCR
ncbi:MAG: hypothetical protein B7733_05330 [Myxococcales bacterium FL481]|nr:MAG: hypothetical protein B7733_05330 [Myxococcales bacterium FL481]